MRDFEEEYKNYIKEDTPDFWNRIEEKLPEKMVEKEADMAKDVPSKKVRPFRRFLPVIAAAACIFIVLPIATSIIRGGSYSDSASSTEYYEATESAVDMEESAAAITEADADIYDEAAEYDEAEASVDRYENDANTISGSSNSSAVNGLQIDVSEMASSDESPVYVFNTLKDVELTAITDSDREGYLFLYTFMVDGQDMNLYVSEDLAAEIEQEGIEVTEGQRYELEYSTQYDDQGDEFFVLQSLHYCT